MNLKKIIEDSGTKAGKYFVLFIQTLIVVSLISFCMETIPDLSPITKKVLWYIEIITVIIFTVEYLLRLSVADKKLKFIFSFFGLIDLLAIAPFYIARGIDLRAIRIFRLFRLFRIFKALRYSKAMQRFKIAFRSIREEMILFVITICFIIFISSIGIYYCEYGAQPKVFKSIFHCIWWSVVTLTTVGYGDTYPVTVCGKIFASIIMLVGIGIIAVPSGLIASALTKVIKDEEEK